MFDLILETLLALFLLTQAVTENVYVFERVACYTSVACVRIVEGCLCLGSLLDVEVEVGSKDEHTNYAYL
jgi:hypothetical protein